MVQRDIFHYTFQGINKNAVKTRKLSLRELVVTYLEND